MHPLSSELPFHVHNSGACPGIRKGGGGQNLKALFFFAFQFFRGGGAAQKIAEKVIFSTKKVAKYRWNNLKFALMTFFFAFPILGGGAQAPWPPRTRACNWLIISLKDFCIVIRKWPNFWPSKILLRGVFYYRLTFKKNYLIGTLGS